MRCADGLGLGAGAVVLLLGIYLSCNLEILHHIPLDLRTKKDTNITAFTIIILFSFSFSPFPSVVKTQPGKTRVVLGGKSLLTQVEVD